MIMILVIALECMAIVANFAMPMLQTSHVRAEAAVIAREMIEVKNAATGAPVPKAARSLTTWSRITPIMFSPPREPSARRSTGRRARATGRLLPASGT